MMIQLMFGSPNFLGQLFMSIPRGGPFRFDGFLGPFLSIIGGGKLGFDLGYYVLLSLCRGLNGRLY